MITENKLKIGIVASKFNEDITNSLIMGAEYFWREGYRQAVHDIYQKESNFHDIENSFILQQYMEGQMARQLLAKMPPQITLLRVPGAYELPQGVQWLAEQGGFKEGGLKEEGFKQGGLMGEVDKSGNNSNNGEDTQLDGIVALGAIIRGDTPHFDYIASAATQGIMDVGLKHNIPVGFGVITANSYEEAQLRSNIEILKPDADSPRAQDKKVDKHKNKTAASNKGYEAAQAVWEMILARKKITDKQ